MRVISPLIFFCSCVVASCQQDPRPVAEASSFRLLYSYEYQPTGDKKYYNIIKHLSKQRRLSLKESHYVYEHDGNYYIYHRYPMTDSTRTKGPIVVSKSEAEGMLAPTREHCLPSAPLLRR